MLMNHEVKIIAFNIIRAVKVSVHSVTVNWQSTQRTITWSGRQKMWASSCWNRRTRVRPDRVPDNSLRCRTPKSAKRIGISLHDRGRWSNIKLVNTRWQT